MLQSPEFPLRPSAAAIWSRCHGYVSLTHGLLDESEDEDNTVREDGTACHWLAHQASQGLMVPAGRQAPNGREITEEMHDAVAVYFDAVAAWGVPAWFELQVVCKRIHDYCGGTLDVGAYDPATNTIFVGDLKFGFRFVDVMNNPQLLCYVVGLQHRLGILSDVGVMVEFLIVQPRSYHRDGPVRRWRVSLVELRAQINHLSNAAHMALAANPVCTINAGCNRCAGRARCETAQAAALGVMEDSYAATPHDLPFGAAEDELRRLQAARDIIEARVTGLEQQVMHGMRRGAASRYYAMESTTGRKVWKPEAEQTVINLATLYGVSITKDKLITPTQAEKLLPAATIAKYAERTPGAMKLVPVESTRAHRALTQR